MVSLCNFVHKCVIRGTNIFVAQEKTMFFFFQRKRVFRYFMVDDFLILIWHKYSITSQLSKRHSMVQIHTGGEKMGRMRENPRYNVVSMRISDEEREILQEIMESTHKSVSDIMREAMTLFRKEWTKPQIENKAA